MDIIGFRKELKETAELTYAMRLPIDQLEAIIAEYRKDYPHSIRLRQPANAIQPFNCYEYALGLAGERQASDIARRNESICVDEHFVPYLIGTGILRAISKNDAKEGDIVIYFQNDIPQHAGIIFSGGIVSKWGEGHLWEHGVDEVPLNYGNDIRYYANISPELVLASFLRYAEEKGADM